MTLTANPRLAAASAGMRVATIAVYWRRMRRRVVIGSARELALRLVTQLAASFIMSAIF